MNKIIPLIIIANLLLSGCVADKYTSITTTLHNKTDHKIIILPFSRGTVKENDTIKLDAFQSVEIGYGTTMGDIQAPMLIVEKFNDLDSIVVIFDEQYRIVHYIYPPDTLSSKYYLFESSRNLDNAENYDLTRKKKQLNYCDYYFTEQDYLDAKD